MLIELFIALALMLLMWLFLRHATHVWMRRSVSFLESLANGAAAWLFVLSCISWFGGILYLLYDFIATKAMGDIWMLLFSLILTGYGIDFFIRSRTELRIDDTIEFIKEALFFRRSVQRRLDILALMRQRRHPKIHLASQDPLAQQRTRLQTLLNKEKELDVQLDLLREGNPVDLTEGWRQYVKQRDVHELYGKVTEVRLEPQRKRLSFFLDFPELSEALLQDEMIALRLNRQVYDFLQTLNAESWLRPFLPFFDSYFLLLRTSRVEKDKAVIRYPFMKLGILAADLRNLEGTYFNPRKLNEIAAVAFNNGAKV